MEETNAPHNDTSITVTTPSNKKLTFTTGNWETKQTVTLSAADDADKVHGTRRITHYTLVYHVVARANLLATEADDDIPQVSASAVTATTATLGITKHTGAWRYKYTSPSGGTCSDSISNSNTASLTGLATSTTYTFAAYSDSGCATQLSENSVTFTTLSPSLASSNVTHNSATLTLSNWNISKDGDWYRKSTKTTDTCTDAISTTTSSVANLQSSTSYTYSAYSDSGCTDLIATAAAFTTNAPPSPTLTVSNIGTSTATLTLANYTGNWRYNHTDGGTTGCTSAGSNSTVNLTGLTPGASYTYEAFSGSLCETSTKIATAAAFTTNTLPNSLQQDQQQQEPPPATPPAAVQNLAGHWDTQDTIILSWDAADSATGYHVVYSTDEMQSWTPRRDGPPRQYLHLPQRDVE